MSLSSGDSPVAGQDAAVGTGAAAFADRSCIAVLLQADPANTENVLIGDSSSQPLVLVAGASVVVPTRNMNLIYRKSASGTQTVNWLVVF